MDWTRIKPYGESDPWTTWIAGIYKVLTYDGTHFHAYYFQDGDANWGWNPSKPPSQDHIYHSPFWPSLESAQRACEDHSVSYAPKPKTVKRALEVRDALIAEATPVPVAGYTVHDEVARLHDEEGMDWTSALVACTID